MDYSGRNGLKSGPENGPKRGYPSTVKVAELGSQNDPEKSRSKMTPKTDQGGDP